MSYDVFYNGEISVTPPMTEADAAIFAAIVKSERTEPDKLLL